MSQQWKADGNINLEEKLKDERKTESSKIREDIMGTEGLKGNKNYSSAVIILVNSYTFQQGKGRRNITMIGSAECGQARAHFTGCHTITKSILKSLLAFQITGKNSRAPAAGALLYV
ncbi:hypothetical protein HGM15179_002824 [Zosterops borbonicus]|uniref:Uncharacterized protein n=1 Tax=Zosterops borbonicus TaxID=364589 RepID=A0A8K1LSJ2_9PASS|nr:hypothetical protein HGM15179_002824 [Zosterops borbonicus]